MSNSDRVVSWYPSLKEALAECARCRGREEGDCSDQCACWHLTKDAKQLEIVTRSLLDAREAHKEIRRAHRRREDWKGPICSVPFIDCEEVA